MIGHPVVVHDGAAWRPHSDRGADCRGGGGDRRGTRHIGWPDISHIDFRRVDVVDVDVVQPRVVGPDVIDDRINWRRAMIGILILLPLLCFGGAKARSAV